MSGETEREPSGWTVDQLKEHYDALLSLRDQRYTDRFVAQEKAIDKSSEDYKSRFEAVNEMRGMVNDLTATLITRTEVEAMFKGLDEKVTTGLKALDDKIDAVREQVKVSAAHGAGIGAAWGYLIGVVGAVGGVIAIIIALSR